MKAALYSSPGSLDVVDRPLREPAAGEIIIRVDACGVCGTDLHIVEGSSHSSPPVVLGHEFAGTVETVGAGVSSVSVGQRVAVDPNIACGMCGPCRRGMVHLCAGLRALGVHRDGGMAERCVLPAAQAHLLPPNFPVAAAPFIEPLSCAVHGIDRARISVGDTVVMTGGGTIGLIMLQLAQRAGAARTIVVEPLEWKRAAALGFGATAAVGPDVAREAVRDLSPDGADVVIECAGSKRAVEMAVDLVRRGGTVELFGVCPAGEQIAIEPHAIFYRELTLVGSYVNPHTFSRSIQLLASGAIRTDAFRITTFPVEQAPQALEALREGGTHKCMIVPAH